MTSSVMTRGFTGHEMLDDTDLVQMNGRIYNPSLGKFLSADPFIQDKYLGASLNRYSYVWNNPLSYTDPSGHFVEWLVLAAVAYGVGEAVPELKPFTNIIVAVSLHLAGQGWVTTLNLSGNALVAAQAVTAGVTGGLSSTAASNSFNSFGIGFAQGVATFGIGQKFGTVGSGGWRGEVGRALSHGTVGGLVSEAYGGNFASGFVAAGFSSVAGTKAFDDFWADVTYSAVAGGIGAEPGGGKFADGAQTGAFVYMFNHALQNDWETVELEGANEYQFETAVEARNALAGKLAELQESTGFEHAGVYYGNTRKGFGYTNAVTSRLPNSVTFDAYAVLRGDKIGLIHSHPNPSSGPPSRTITMTAVGRADMSISGADLRTMRDYPNLFHYAVYGNKTLWQISKNRSYMQYVGRVE